jgi:hypothetical protein
MPIVPTWPQLKIGPWVRREKDKRTYVGLFKETPTWVSGARRAAILAVGERRPEAEINRDARRAQRPLVFVFRGMGGLFAPFANQHRLVRAELKAITRDQASASSGDGAPLVGVHVRLGDFQAPDRVASQGGAWNFRTSMDWYVETVLRLKASSSFRRFKVFSDGEDRELRELLSIPGVERAPEKSALQSLWDMSESSLLVASGSTFSMWASFLGRMPVIWPKGQLRQRLYEDRRKEIELEVGEEWPSDFASAALTSQQVASPAAGGRA